MFSASQIAAADDKEPGGCLRKWAFQSIEKRPRTQNASAALGTAVHGQIEAYLKSGGATPLDTKTEAGEIAMAGFGLWPESPYLQIESRFFVQIGDHHFMGFKDLRWLSDLGPEVGDHKTTSNFNYAKTATDLETNIQSSIYAYSEMAEYGFDQSVGLHWIYYRTRKPYRAFKVVREDGNAPRVTLPVIQPTIDRIHAIADNLAMIKRGGYRALDLPPNPASCETFGGCPFQQDCNLSDQDKVFAIMANTQEILALMAQKINPPANGAAQPVQAAPVATAPANGGQIPPPPQWPEGINPADGWRWYYDPTINQWTVCPPNANPNKGGFFWDEINKPAAAPVVQAPPAPVVQTVTHPETGIVYNPTTGQIIHDPRFAQQAPPAAVIQQTHPTPTAIVQPQTATGVTVALPTAPPASEEKPKRVRRTKAQMAAAGEITASAVDGADEDDEASEAAFLTHWCGIGRFVHRFLTR